MHINVLTKVIRRWYWLGLTMDVFKYGQLKFRSLPRCLTNPIQSLSFERLSHRKSIANSSSLPKRRNGVCVDSYNELRKLILQSPLPTTVLKNHPTKEFLLNGIGFPLASSSYYILTLINECSTLILFNKDEEICRIDLSNSLILVYDICWSIKLNMFLMAGYALYTFNPRSYKLSKIDQIELNRGQWIVSITTDNQIEKQWLEKDFLRKKDFLAHCIRINEWNVLALTIKQNNGLWRIDLFNSKNFNRLYKISLLDKSIPGMRNCLIMPYNRYWIVINNCSTSEQIILIDQYGKIIDKLYIDKAYGLFNLCCMGNEAIGMILKNKLAIYKI